MGSGKLLKKAFRKYGKDNFLKEIICMCDSQEELNRQEIFWIEKLNSRSTSGQGYNLTIGGEGTNGLKMTEESKRKLSVVASKRIGELNPFWGKTLSQEHIDKMTRTRVAAITGGNNPSAVRVLCIEEDLIFDTCTKAAEWCGLKYPTSILKAAKGQQHTACGYTWMILPKEENIPQEILTQDGESLTMELHQTEHTRNQHHVITINYLVLLSADL